MGKLSVVAERTKDGFSVYAENEPFAGMGNTEAEAIADMKTGIEFYIRIAKERGYRYNSYLDGDYEIELKYDRVGRPAGYPAGRASHTTVRTGRVYSGSLRCGAIDTKSADIDW